MEGNPNAETSWNVDGMDRHALNFASDAQAYGPSGAVVRNQTMREESGYESGRRRTALTSEKMAVFAPIPTASVRTATSVKPGLRRHPRSAYRTSCATWPTSFFGSAMWREGTSARCTQSTSQHADTVRQISRRSGRVGALERRQLRSANQYQQVTGPHGQLADLGRLLFSVVVVISVHLNAVVGGCLPRVSVDAGQEKILCLWSEIVGDVPKTQNGGSAVRHVIRLFWNVRLARYRVAIATAATLDQPPPARTCRYGLTCRRLRSCARIAAALGSVTTNVAPCPGPALSAEIDPPCISTR